MFHRRIPWPPRPVQWTLGRLLIVIALTALGLGLIRLSVATRWVLLFSTGLALGPRFLARKGYTLTDIFTVLAIVLLVTVFLLPAMVQARFQSAGRRTIPIRVPADFYTFLFGDR
jgi:hypothetical protein